MTPLSKLRPLLQSIKSAKKTGMQREMSERRIFPMEPSRWQWTKFKDLYHFYIMLGVIPCGLFVGYHNLFTGPATLSEIPEDYEPEYWEYCRNPVSRFLARYLFTRPQQEYEKYCHHLFIEHEKQRLKQLEAKIVQLMKERDDYRAYYFQPVAAKYYRRVREGSDAVIELQDPVPKEQA